MIYAKRARAAMLASSDKNARNVNGDNGNSTNNNNKKNRPAVGYESIEPQGARFVLLFHYHYSFTRENFINCVPSSSNCMSCSP